MRTGRVKLTAGQDKVIIYVPNGGAPSIKYYRIFNSGSDIVTRDDITIDGVEKAGGTTVVLPHAESVDVGVRANNITVRAGTAEAEVVYEFLG